MKNVRKTVDKILNVCILVLFIAMFGVTTLNVIMRYIFNSPLSFAVEFGRYTFAGMVYLGSIYVMRDDGHIGLDIVVDALPEPLHTIVKKFSRVLVLAYLAVFFCMSTRMVIENWTNRSSTMHLPMSVVYLAMVIGSAGMFIEELLLLLGKGGSEKLDAGDMGGGMEYVDDHWYLLSDAAHRRACCVRCWHLLHAVSGPEW